MTTRKAETNRIASFAFAAVSLVAALILAATSPVSGQAWADEDEQQAGTQLAGRNRYETAVHIANEAYPDGVEGAIVVTGESFADALSASSLAGLFDYPVLLTRTDRLDDYTGSALIELGVEHVILVGGEAAVTAESAAQIEDVVGAGNVERVAGGNRYGTAQAVYERGTEDDVPRTWSSTALIASGADYPDAISASGYAFATGSPLFLADPDEDLSEDTIWDLQSGYFTQAVILGGTSAVSYAIERDLHLNTDLDITRLEGVNRYETSREIAKFVQDELGSATAACMATGLNYPDALAGCSLAGKNGGLVLLADIGATAAIDVLSSDTVQGLYYLGGEEAVPPLVRRAAETALGWRSDHLIPLAGEDERFIYRNSDERERNRVDLDEDGTFTGCYYKWNRESSCIAEDSDLYLSDFRGSFNLDGKIDDYTYELSIKNIYYEVEPGTTEEIGFDDIESMIGQTNFSVQFGAINVKYTYAIGLVSESGEILPGGFELYLEGHDMDTLPESVIEYLEDNDLMPDSKYDPLPIDILYNVDSDIVFCGELL